MSIRRAALNSYAKKKEELEKVKSDNFSWLVRLVNELPGEDKVGDANNPIVASTVSACKSTVAIYDGLAFALTSAGQLVEATHTINITDVTDRLEVAVFCSVNRLSRWVIVHDLAQLGEIVEGGLDSLANFRYSKAESVKVMEFEYFMSKPQVPESPEDD